MAITLVKPGEQHSSTPTDSGNEKLALVKGEVVSLLEDRLEELRLGAEKLHATMEQAQHRIRTQGFSVKLDDLKTGQWHRLANEVRVLQDVLAIFESHE